MVPTVDSFTSPLGHNIAYRVWGSQPLEDAVFCVHGLSRNGLDFEYFAENLSKDHNVISIDIVGRGQSDWLTDKTLYNYDTYVQDCESLIEYLGLKNVHWVGTSMGGIIGMIIASKKPHYLKSIVLNDIGPIIPGKSLKRVLQYVSHTPTLKTEERAWAFLREKLATFGVEDDAHWKHLFNISFVRAEEGYQLTYDPNIVTKPFVGQKIPDIDLWEFWYDMSQPTLVLRGERSDILLADTAKEMTKTGPKAELIEFDGIGHAPTLMSNTQIGIVRQWLERQ